MSRLPFATAVEWSGDDPDKLGISRANDGRTHSPEPTQAKNASVETPTATRADSNSSSNGKAVNSDISSALADSGRECEPHRNNDSLLQTHDSNSSELPDPVRLCTNSASTRAPSSVGNFNYSTFDTHSSPDSDASNSDLEIISADGGKEQIVGYRPSSPPRPSTAMPVVDIPISRKGLTEADFIVPILSELLMQWRRTTIYRSTTSCSKQIRSQL